MKDPLKIIHKFKNNNRRIQYKIYIFIGSLVPNEVMNILELIKNKNFYDTLITLNSKQYKILEEFYGNKWYEKFFISYHINNSIKTIITSLTKKKELENHYSKEWYQEHINIPKINKVSYSFASNYYDNLNDKKKLKLSSKKVELDFRTYAF
jgi:hypothetical protein